jgi:hypothetical protein
MLAAFFDAYVKTPGKPESDQILSLLSRFYFSRSQQGRLFTSASFLILNFLRRLPPPFPSGEKPGLAPTKGPLPGPPPPVIFPSFKIPVNLLIL